METQGGGYVVVYIRAIFSIVDNRIAMENSYQSLSAKV